MGALEIVLVVLAVIAALMYRHEWRKEKKECKYWQDNWQDLRQQWYMLNRERTKTRDELAAVKAELDLYKNHEAETRVVGQKVRITTEGTTMQGTKVTVYIGGLIAPMSDRFDCTFTHEGKLYRCIIYIGQYDDYIMSRNPEQIIPALDNYEAHVIKL